MGALSMEKKTDWTNYYSKEKSWFSKYTQQFTLEKILAYYELIGNKKQTKILELGGGNSCFAEGIVKNRDVAAYNIIDNNSLAVDLFNKKTFDVPHFGYEMDLTSDIEASGEYDFVFSIGLIEHFPPDDQAMVVKNHFKFVKPGGLVFISYPTPTLKYKICRGIMETLGKWQFVDEVPLKFDTIKELCLAEGEVISVELNNKLFLTQEIVVVRKKWGWRRFAGDDGLITKQVVIIPAYKPGESLIDLTKALSQYFHRIIIIDDGSGDKYKNIFSAVNTIKNVSLIRNEVNLGKGAALKRAFRYGIEERLVDVNGGVITVDADGQHLVKDVVRVSQEMEKHPAALVMGCRSFSSDDVPMRSKLGNNISKFIYRLLCRIDLTDTQTGLRGIPYNFIEEACKISGKRYEYETCMLLQAKKQQIPFYEVPITTVYENNNNTSHFNPILDSLIIYKEILKFALSSLCAVCVDYVVFCAMMYGGSNVFSAVYVGRTVAGVINFYLNRNIVFYSKQELALQLLKYAGLVCFSGTISAVFIEQTIEFFSPALSKVIVELLMFFFNYVVQRIFVFKSSKK